MIETLERLARRVLNLVGLGKLNLVDDTGAIQVLQISTSQLEIQDRVARLAEFGLASRPPAGSDVLAVFLNGERTSSTVVATGHGPSRPRDLAEGEAMLYSLAGQRVYLKADRIIVEAKGMPVEVNNATTVTVNASAAITLKSATSIALDAPTVSVTGNLTVAGNIAGGGTISDATGTMGAMRTVYNGHDHPHGSDAGTTGDPNQAM